VHRGAGRRRARARGAGVGVRWARRLSRLPPLVLLTAARRAHRPSAGARDLLPGAAEPLSPRAALQDPQPARRRDRALARAPALRDGRAVREAPRLPAPRLLLRRPADRRGAPGTEPGGVGVLLPELRTRGRPRRLQPGGAL